MKKKKKIIVIILTFIVLILGVYISSIIRNADMSGYSCGIGSSNQIINNIYGKNEKKMKLINIQTKLILSENKEGTTPGIPLDLGDSKVIFGFILHKGEEMDESVAELVEFLKSRLPKH